MKPALLITSLLFATTFASAQTSLTDIQKQVWDSPTPEFAQKTSPEKYAKESAVVLARFYSKTRVLNLTSLEQTTIFHERIKINDKPALEAYSTLEYQKKEEKVDHVLFIKVKNVKDDYIGAKVIKPNGKEIIVNTSEEVLLKNDNSDKKGKLAIPGLEVGDILDYFISSVSKYRNLEDESFANNDNLILLADEYPVLSYESYFQFSKRLQVQYISANGAPQLVETKGPKDEHIFKVKITNLPKFQGQLWVSPFRQYPYFEISSGMRMVVGNLSKYNGKSPMLDYYKTSFESAFNEREFNTFEEPKKKLKEYFDGRKGLKNAAIDTTIKVLYDIWKYDTFCHYSGDDVNALNYRTANPKINTINMSLLLTDLKVDHDVILVSSRNTNTLANTFAMTDFTTMIRVNTPKPIFICFDDVVNHFNEIPIQYQGEKAIRLTPIRKSAVKYIFAEEETLIPVTGADKNQVIENLKVSLQADNMQKLKIDRDVKQSGYLRHDDQKALLSGNEIDQYYTQLVKGDELAKRISKSSDTRKNADAINSGLTKSPAELKKAFTEEIKSQYDLEPSQVSNMKIINPALENLNPFFEFSSSFVLDNLVKKAGSNYILDVGKLAGSFYKLDEKDQIRTVDVYMPCARTFSYSINIAIPQGYAVKGMEEITQKKMNKTGLFSSAATVSGNTLTITVNRSYNNNFEKAADWPLVKEIIEAASTFNDQKILFEKKG